MGSRASGNSSIDLSGGVRDTRPLPLLPGVQILSISCSFWENLAKSRPHLGEILDPPWFRLHSFKRDCPETGLMFKPPTQNYGEYKVSKLTHITCRLIDVRTIEKATPAAEEWIVLLHHLLSRHTWWLRVSTDRTSGNLWYHVHTYERSLTYRSNKRLHEQPANPAREPTDQWDSS